MSASERTPLLSINAGDEDSVLLMGSETRPPEKVRNALGTLNGCYVPCCLNIMGAVMFMRLGWATGEAGMIQALSMLGIATVVTVLTGLSLSAIATNGDMGGGGSYFMISRSLGPEFGGAIGFCFYLAYTVSVAFYIIATGQEIQQTWFAVGWNANWTTIWLSSICLFVCLLNCWGGARYFTKFNIILFAGQMAAALLGIVSFLIPHTYHYYNPITSETEDRYIEFPKYFVENLMSNYTSAAEYPGGPCFGTGNGNCNYNAVFAIIFPMVTGIMEGANLSGDLKDPARSLPAGTLWAIFTACGTYFLIILIQGASMHREWLIDDLNIYQNASFGSSYLIVIGILVTSYSSGIGAMFGGSRILQAIARDDLFPFFRPFAKGSIVGDEPRRAAFLTFIISQCVLFMGNIDVVAAVITAIFCLSYALINLTCLFLSVTGAPNFRPTFKYFNKWTALLGFITNIGVMFYLSWLYGLIGTAVLLVVFVYLVVMAPARNWGEVTQAIMFHQVRKYLLLLDTGKSHSKFWRPNVLLVLDNPAPALLGLCNGLKKGGLLLVGHNILGSFVDSTRAAKVLKAAWNSFMRTHKVKGFAQVSIAPTVRDALQSMLLGSGLGGLSPNTVCVPLLTVPPVPVSVTQHAAHIDNVAAFLNNVPATEEPIDTPPTQNLPVASYSEYCGILHDVLKFDHNLLVAANFDGGGLHVHKRQVVVSFTSPKKFTDIWIVGDFTIVSDPAGTLHSIWGYTSSPYPAHAAHPFLIIPQPLEASEGMVTDDRAPVGLEGLSAFILQLGAIADQTRLGLDSKRMAHKNHQFRIMHVCASTSTAMDSLDDHRSSVSFIKQLCLRARLQVLDDNIHVIMLHDVSEQSPTYRSQCSAAGVEVLPLQNMSAKARNVVVNEVMVHNSSVDTALIVAALPFPGLDLDEQSAETYVQSLQTLTHNLGPTILVCNGEDTPFISTSL